ncbi:MAG: endolytic transglycosylase MltG [Chitinophagaceae bacterium]|nr:endolytic transglycosylase MltG [Chitinophagaceae bacterium]
MLRIFLIVLIVVALAVVAIVARFFFSNTAFDENSKFLYIHTGRATKEEVMKAVKEGQLLNNPGSFDIIATQMDVWPSLRPGRYEVKKGMSLFRVARMLRNGQQSPVNLVITKLRTKENLASLVNKKFETDSIAVMSFLTNQDSLKNYGLDTNTVMTAVFPNTYTYLWNTGPSGIFKKLYAEHNKVWNDDRKRKADALGITPTDAYILASIIEEETNNNQEKGLIASVYINRLAKNMNLGADPTVKFALRDFGLKRIYEKHLAVESPYNTYRKKGLPPGPICTPSLQTLDQVLNAPKTDYLFFVAKKDFTPGHVFSAKYQEHLKYAREYQQALNLQEQKRQKTAREEVDE